MTAREVSLCRRCKHAVEAALAYLFYGLFRILPLEAASAAGGFVMRHIGPRLGVSRTARKNLDFVFPEKTREERRVILADMWENLGRVIGEYPHLHRISGNIEIIGKDHVEKARDGGKPVIFFAGHLANWEINGVGARQMGLPLHLVYRKPNNPYVDGLLRHARASGAAGYIEKGAEGARAILGVLKKGGAVGMLVDQKLNEGMAIPFFGREAMTAPALAHFALKFGLPLYPVRVERMGGVKFRVTVHPTLEVVKTGDLDADTRRILTEMNEYLEKWIRERPAQWLWTHRRWPD